MATIDDLDISVHNSYAIRMLVTQEMHEQLRLEQASSIPPQTQVVISSSQLTEMDLLFGVVPTLTPWAYFFPPKQFKTLRRSPFSFSRIAPSLKSVDEGEEEYSLLMSIPCQTPEEEKEKALIATCFKQISKLNNWLGFIVGRVGQFLQG